MKKIRFGNDIPIAWTINRNDQPEDFTGKTLRLTMTGTSGTTEVTDYTIEGNVLRWMFWGKDQHKPSTYHFCLVENGGEEGMFTIDTCDVLRLVSRSCAADDCDGPFTMQVTSNIDDKGVTCSSVITVPANGLSAYEIAVKHGFEGTEEDFLAELRGKDGLSAYETAVKYGFKGTEADFAKQMRSSYVIGAISSESTSEEIEEAIGGYDNLLEAIQLGVPLVDGGYGPFMSIYDSARQITDYDTDEKAIRLYKNGSYFDIYRGKDGTLRVVYPQVTVEPDTWPSVEMTISENGDYHIPLTQVENIYWCLEQGKMFRLKVLDYMHRDISGNPATSTYYIQDYAVDIYSAYDHESKQGYYRLRGSCVDALGVTCAEFAIHAPGADNEGMYPEPMWEYLSFNRKSWAASIADKPLDTEVPTAKAVADYFAKKVGQGVSLVRLDASSLFGDTASVTAELSSRLAAYGNNNAAAFPLLYGGEAIGNICPSWVRTSSGVTNMMCLADNKIYYFEIQGTTVQRAELAIS